MGRATDLAPSHFYLPRFSVPCLSLVLMLAGLLWESQGKAHLMCLAEVPRASHPSMPWLL